MIPGKYSGLQPTATCRYVMEGRMRSLGIVGAVFVVAFALATRSGDAAKPVAPPSGLIAGAAFQCPSQGLIFQQPMTLSPSNPAVNFGSSITFSATAPFNTFVLQPGIYQIHLSGDSTVEID